MPSTADRVSAAVRRGLPAAVLSACLSLTAWAEDPAAPAPAANVPSATDGQSAPTAPTPPAAPQPDPAAAQPPPPAPTPPQPAPPAPPPSTQPTPPLHLVQKGALSQTIQGEGVFLPAGAFEVRPRLKVHAGPLTITTVAPHGSTVKQGDVLLAFDPTLITAEMTGAEAELASAKAVLVKAEKDAELSAASDARVLRIQEAELGNAESALKLWNEIDGPQMLLGADLSVKTAKSNVEDQEDELNQLKKMYETEDLTTATADIVIKRAVRSHELSKIALKMAEDRSNKVKTHQYPIAKQEMLDYVEGVRHKLAVLKNSLELSAVTRKTALTNARLGHEAVERKVRDLKQDVEAFTVKAPADGVVFYGSAGDGAWAAVDPKSLRVSERLTPGGPVMTVFSPGKFRIEMSVSEQQSAWVSAGLPAKVTPVAFPESACDATSGAAAIVAKPPSGIGYGVQVELPQVDGRIRPGMKASVRIEAKGDDGVLLVPVAAVAKNKVWVRAKDGTEAVRDVVTGRSDGKSVEIRGGLNEGEEVLAQAKK